MKTRNEHIAVVVDSYTRTHFITICVRSNGMRYKIPIEQQRKCYFSAYENFDTKS